MDNNGASFGSHDGNYHIRYLFACVRLAQQAGAGNGEGRHLRDVRGWTSDRTRAGFAGSAVTDAEATYGVARITDGSNELRYQSDWRIRESIRMA